MFIALQMPSCLFPVTRSVPFRQKQGHRDGFPSVGLAVVTPSLRTRPIDTVFRRRAESEDSYEDPLEVVDIDREYCNDFVCTSSPSVEETIKAFAVDLQRPGRWTLSRFPEDVVYKDPFRSFKGRQKYERLNWISESVTRPRVKVVELRMLERDEAEVDWRLMGKLLGQAIDVSFVSRIKLNPLSGRIAEHRDVWNLKDCSPFAANAFTLSRAFWSVQQLQTDAKESFQELGRKFGSEDDDDASPYIVDPRDPYTFYEKNEDNFKRDALSFLTFVAVLYLVYRAYFLIFQL